MAYLGLCKNIHRILQNLPESIIISPATFAFCGHPVSIWACFWTGSVLKISGCRQLQGVTLILTTPLRHPKFSIGPLHSLTGPKWSWYYQYIGLCKGKYKYRKLLFSHPKKKLAFPVIFPRGANLHQGPRNFTTFLETMWDFPKVKISSPRWCAPATVIMAK